MNSRHTIPTTAYNLNLFVGISFQFQFTYTLIFICLLSVHNNKDGRCEICIFR